MSGGWNDYVNYLMENGTICQAYIVSLEGKLCAASENLPGPYENEITNDDYSTGTETVDELANLVAIWKNKGQSKGVNKSGMRLNNIKFQTLNLDEETNVWQLACNIKDHNGKSVIGGATIAMTGAVYIIGIWRTVDDVKYSSECSAKVEELQQLLLENGS